MSIWDTPLVVLAFFTWFLGPPADLADVAQHEALRRQLVPRSSHALTNDDVAATPRRPLPTPPAGAADASTAVPTPAAPDSAKKDTETHDESWWRARITAARETLDRDQVLAQSLQSRINGLDAEASARDDPAQRQTLYLQRDRTLKELEAMKDQIVKDVRTLAEVEEDARRQNVPAGWLR
jgi:hypothetical protein